MAFAASAPRVLVDVLPTSRARNAVLVAGGTAFIAAAAQVAIPLPFSPVPLTGQTLAVLSVGALLGSSRAVLSTALYLVAALAGLPVLAPTAEGTHLTGAAVLGMPTLGYVLGFIAASALVGRLAELGATRTPLRTAATMVAGNLVIYSVGVPVLAVVTGAGLSTAIGWGLTPFLIGDLLKVALAAGLFPAAWALVRKFDRVR